MTIMEINFSVYGSLRNDYLLSFNEFQNLFGKNEQRLEKIKNLLIFLKIFWSFGCSTIYVAGSFVSIKEFPGDIDVCVDITTIKYAAFKKEYPEFFKDSGIRKYQKQLKCHFFFFDTYSTEILDFFRFDRDGNPRGLVKISIREMNNYD
jgi:hypothetical protein